MLLTFIYDSGIRTINETAKGHNLISEYYKMIKFLIAICLTVLTATLGLVLVDFSQGGHTTQQPLMAWIALFALKYYQAYHVWTDVK